MIRIIQSPPILSEAVSHVAAEWSVADFEADASAWSDWLPPRLHRAVAKRRAEYVAGRLCAVRALELAGCAEAGRLEAEEGRGPRWPPGYTGSITHTEGYVAAAAVRRGPIRAVGIDAERIMQSGTARDVGGMVLGETAVLRRKAGEWSFLDDTRFTTLVFSAKESVYKCLNREVPRELTFRDVALDEIDAAGGTLTLRITADLNAVWRKGARLRLRWVMQGGLVQTGMELVVGG